MTMIDATMNPKQLYEYEAEGSSLYHNNVTLQVADQNSQLPATGPTAATFTISNTTSNWGVTSWNCDPPYKQATCTLEYVPGGLDMPEGETGTLTLTGANVQVTRLPPIQQRPS